MANSITLAQFSKIASGDYNAGQIDIKTKDDGSVELVKINNRVWKTSENNVVLSPERILEVKEAFLNALKRAGVSQENMAEIRDRLGLPAELTLPGNKEQRTGLLKTRFSPLTRAQAREIIDEYANFGKGFTEASKSEISWETYEAGLNTRNMSASNRKTRDKLNMASMALYDSKGSAGVNYSITDAMSLLSTSRPLSDLGKIQSRRITGVNAVNERLAKRTALVNSFQGLVAQALKMLPADVHESVEFRLAGETVKLVKGEDGTLHALVGKGELTTNVNLGMNAETFVARLLGRAVSDSKLLGNTLMKSLLSTVYDRDLEGGLVASERKSLTRQFAALILARKSGDKVDLDALIRGNYNTGILVEMAERAIEGEDVGDCKAKLDAYHAKLVSDNADLPKEMKDMLENVANVPLEKSNGGGEFVVKAPITGDINEVVRALPPPAPIIPTVPRDIGGINGIKDFVADLVFSDDTMVGDVLASKPGEALRKMLTEDKNIIALAEIIKNPAILDIACAPQIADAVKDGLGKMVDILDAAFKSATRAAGAEKTLAVAATEDDFLKQLSLFMKDQNKLPGAELAKFDNLILAMANKGCENIQLFINNDVFQIGNANVNAQGGIVNDPYKNLSAEQLKTKMQNTSLNEMLDSSSNADAPGQIGFFRQVISNYFTSLGKADKRSCFAAALRYAQAYDFTGLEGEALVSAQQVAINKFTGAILKGTSPLLQKMMQGLPREIVGAYADALEDMKSNLAPIPRKIVQAHFMQMINESKDKGDGEKIESIELVKSLGAASVGEAFLCKFKIQGVAEPKELVVKIMRHDAERRVKTEGDIFTAAAEKIGPGMATTWKGQLKQYMTEFDFRNEANNVNAGVELYDIQGHEDHPLQAIAPKVKSMKMSTLVTPKKDVMVAEVAEGQTLDKFFKQNIAEIRKAASAVFEQNAATGRIKWVDGPEIDPETNKPKKVPVIKKNLPGGALPNMIDWCREHYKEIKDSQKMLVQATKAWFQEALLGSGKFHGDTHSGNLMVGPEGITFIDFGNLYELKSEVPLLDENGKQVIDPNTHQPKMVNERHELLRIIMGATFRDKSFILEGFEKLLSPAGKVALKANRAKAEAILDAIMKKGRFSYDMVYRLNAAVVELQKLGLELPPQINCFVQSMARLSNTLSEMNTIINQTSTLLDAADGYIKDGPAPQRDELDILGMALDFRTSPEGKVLVEDDEGIVGLEKGGKDVQISAFCHHLSAEGFGGFSFEDDFATFSPGGEYHGKVVDRLLNSADPVEEARKLIAMLESHADAEHNESMQTYIDVVNEAAAKLQTDLAAADTPQKKTAAVKDFATTYGRAITPMFSTFQEVEGRLVYMRTFESVEAPTSFAKAIVTTLMENFDTLNTTFAESSVRIKSDVYFITSNELNAGWFAGEAERVQVIQNDAEKMAGDGSYQIDIGV